MMIEAPGFFGKLPARGDFLARRVPPSMAGSWDDWLAAFTSAVREEAGAEWPQAWLTAPLWHFALGAGLAPPIGAAGVMIASTDRVGRMFPFTIIGPSTGIPDPAWSATVQTLILDALADDFDPNTLDRALAELGPPPAATPLAPGESVWCCEGSERVEATSRSFMGLPVSQDAVAMVMGDGRGRIG